MARKSWIDPDTNEPLIDDYAQQLDSYIETFADGVVSGDELSKQEANLTALLKEVEPLLDDAAHEKVTKLLCELTAFNIMQMTHEIQATRVSAFKW